MHSSGQKRRIVSGFLSRLHWFLVDMKLLTNDSHEEKQGVVFIVLLISKRTPAYRQLCMHILSLIYLSKPVLSIANAYERPMRGLFKIFYTHLFLSALLLCLLFYIFIVLIFIVLIFIVLIFIVLIFIVLIFIVLIFIVLIF
ncbi:hypothetical protein BDF14DRAFT_689761 [Spinellus fusiger]|nr:hypothetical protein BDF14DRAFT_689761 [Spinellus fusiger]